MLAKADNVAARNTTEAVVPAGCPDFAAPDDKKVCRVTGGNEPLRIEHQSLVRSSLGRLNTGLDAIQLGVGIELLVLLVGAGPSEGGSEQRDASIIDRRFLVLGDNNDGRRRDRHTRVLVRGCLDAARHHQPDMNAVFHPVGIDTRKEPFDELIGGDVHFEIERPCAFVKPRQMRPKKRNTAIMEAKALPNSIAKDEARIEDGHRRLRARYQFTVDRDENIRISRVVFVSVRTVTQVQSPLSALIASTLNLQRTPVPNTGAIAETVEIHATHFGKIGLYTLILRRDPLFCRTRCA